MGYDYDELVSLNDRASHDDVGNHDDEVNHDSVVIPNDEVSDVCYSD